MGIGTKCVQDGYQQGNGEPRQIPIIQTTTFKYDTSQDMGKLFDLKAEGYFYSGPRIQRMTMLLQRSASLEGGTAAMLTSSGQAANFYAVFNIASCGDHVVASSTIYGRAHYNLFAVTMKKMGVRIHICFSACNGRGTGCGIPAEYQGCIWGNHRQSGTVVTGYREICRCGSQTWRTAYRGQYLCHAGTLPSY